MIHEYYIIFTQFLLITSAVVDIMYTVYPYNIRVRGFLFMKISPIHYFLL